MEYSKTKILHIIGTLGGSGAERQLQLLANNTDSNRYHTAILFLHRGMDSHHFNETTELIRIPRGQKWNIFSLWYRICKAVMNYRPDVVHLWLPEIVTIPAAIAGKLSGAYIISAVRGTRRSVRSVIRRLRSSMRYLDYLIADRIVTNFNPSREPWLFRTFFSRKKGCIIRNAIVLNTAGNPSIAAVSIPKNTTFMLWYTGRIISSKCLDVLLQSFIDLRKEGLDLSLIICGTGDPKTVQRLKDEVRANALDNYVIFPGYRDDWQRLVQNADLFVLPSMAEGMPNVLFEAMLLGIPCIATDIPVLRDILTHKTNVWMVRAGSHASLTSGIREMLLSPSLREQIACTGQLYAQRFSIVTMIEAYDALYRNGIKSGV